VKELVAIAPSGYYPHLYGTFQRYGTTTVYNLVPVVLLDSKYDMPMLGISNGSTWAVTGLTDSISLEDTYPALGLVEFGKDGVATEIYSSDVQSHMSAAIADHFADGSDIETSMQDWLTNVPAGVKQDVIDLTWAVNDLLFSYVDEDDGFDDFSAVPAIPSTAGPLVAGTYLRVKFLRDNFSFSSGLTTSEYSSLASAGESFIEA
jgi:hypothetical protein